MPRDGKLPDNIDPNHTIEKLTILRELCATNMDRGQSSFLTCLWSEATGHKRLRELGILNFNHVGGYQFFLGDRQIGFYPTTSWWGDCHKEEKLRSIAAKLADVRRAYAGAELARV